MRHVMNLHPQPFSMIASGEKTIELRLLDEKRQLISVGDTIVFKNSQNPEMTLSCIVRALHVFSSFEELYKALPLDKCGYTQEELSSAKAEDMDVYYPPEKQEKWGVVGIEIELI